MPTKQIKDNKKWTKDMKWFLKRSPDGTKTYKNALHQRKGGKGRNERRMGEREKISEQYVQYDANYGGVKDA